MGGFTKSVLILSLLVVQCSNSFAGPQNVHKCIHDQIAVTDKHLGKFKAKVHREKRNTEEELFAPGRIYAYPDSSFLENEDFAYLWKNPNSPFWRAVNTLSQGLLVRPVEGNLTIPLSCDMYESGENEGECINGTLKPLCSIFDVPDYLLGTEWVCYGENGTCDYEGPDGPGVPADYILIAGVVNDTYCDNSIISFSSVCGIDYIYNTPITGYINICPKNLKKATPIDEIDDILYNVLIHELTHAFGFSSSLFTFYDLGNNPLVNKSFQSKIIKALDIPEVNEVAQDYFNCTELNYVPLENEGGIDFASSHWEARLLRHEVMAAAFSSDYTVYSNFTWKYFDNSGWFKVNYTFTEAIDQYELEWGKGNGCGFVTESCDNPDTYEYVCESYKKQCTFDRISKGICNSVYFFDNCQVVRSYLDGACLFAINYQADSEDVFERAQTYGKLSRCFDVTNDDFDYYPACYEIEIVIYSETKEYAYKVIGHHNFTDGPVWCTEGKHVFLGDSYILCPSINDLLLHWDTNEITVIDEYVPPPLCDENCETCAVAHDKNQCLTCDEGYVLLGPPPNACNGTDYMELVCPSEVDTEFHIQWNETAVGVTVESNCPPGRNGIAKRTCLVGSMWSIVDIDLCVSENILNIAMMVSDLLSENNSLTVEVQNEVISDAVKNLTVITEKQETSSYIADVANIVNTVTDIITVLTLNLGDKNITNPFLEIGVLDVYNNILDESYEDAWSSIGMDEGGSEQLMENIESFGNYAGMFHIFYEEETLSIEKENLVLNIETPDLTVKPNDIIFPLVYEYTTYIENESFAQIRIPHEHLTERQNSTTDKIAVVNALVRNIANYLPNSTTNELKVATQLISTQVLSDIESSNIDVVLNFTTKYIINATNPQCVFWNFSSGNGTGGWSTDGIEVVNIAEINEYEYHVICNSSHVTPFTVLVNIHQVEIDENKYKALNIVSYIGLSVSSFCLILTIIFLLMLKSELIKAVQYFIHLNLSIALLSLYLVFCFGIDSSIIDTTNSKIACTVVAAVIHYLIVASFTWMLCEAIMLFILLVIVFSSAHKKWYLFLLVGWGTPIIPVALSVGLFHDHYGVEGEFCWIDFSNQAAMWLFIGPIIIILIINFVIFILAFHVMIRYRLRRNKDDVKKGALAVAKQSVVAIVTLVPLLGFTWAFGLLIVNQQSTVFAWLFTFFSCFQGTFIFIFNIMRNEKIRAKLRNILCSKRKEKKPKLMLFEKRGVVDFGQIFLNPLTTELSAHSSNAPLYLNSSTPQSRETTSQ